MPEGQVGPAHEHDARLAFTDAEMLALEPTLRSWAYTLTRGDLNRIDDLIQATFLRMLMRRELYRPEAGTGLHAWACTIMRNELLNALRRERGIKRRSGKWELNEAPQGIFSEDFAEAGIAPSNPDAGLELEQVLKLLRSDGERGEVVLMLAIGYTTEEIAQEFGLKAVTVRTRVNKGRDRLETALGRNHVGRRSWQASLSKKAR